MEIFQNLTYFMVELLEQNPTGKDRNLRGNFLGVKNSSVLSSCSLYQRRDRELSGTSTGSLYNIPCVHVQHTVCTVCTDLVVVQLAVTERLPHVFSSMVSVQPVFGGTLTDLHKGQGQNVLQLRKIAVSGFKSCPYDIILISLILILKSVSFI